MKNVSIIIPSYNQRAFLEEAIESALNQTELCEVIVVDDGSTDDSLLMAQAYKSEIKVISQVNKGLASARNTGIMNATGDWILPLDADDVLLENCVAFLDGEADVIAPSFRTFGTTNSVVILMPNPTLEDFEVANRIGYCSLIRKSALLAVGGYSPKMTWGYEDYHLWFNLLSRGYTIQTIPKVLWKYRTKENSMITTAQAHHDELMAQIYKDFP